MSVTTSEIVLISCNVMSGPPEILKTIPVALSMEFSTNGADMAATAASSALFLPEETPTPNMAVPESFMTVLTSAKSTLTKPETVIMSEIP